MRLVYALLAAVSVALPAAAQPIIVPLSPQRTDPPPPPPPSPVPVAPPQAEATTSPDAGTRNRPLRPPRTSQPHPPPRTGASGRSLAAALAGASRCGLGLDPLVLLAVAGCTPTNLAGRYVGRVGDPCPGTASLSIGRGAGGVRAGRQRPIPERHRDAVTARSRRGCRPTGADKKGFVQTFTGQVRGKDATGDVFQPALRRCAGDDA